MRKIVLALLLLKFFFLTAQNPNLWDTAWVNSYGGPATDVGRDVKETSDKGFIIVGTTNTFGSGNTSFYIIKTDSLGHHQWSKSIGTSNNDVAYSVELANDGGYFFSGFSNWNSQTGYDGYVVKTDNLGNTLWAKNYGGSDWDFIYNSCLMPDGGLVLCGESYTQSNGGSDAYLIRTNSNGDTLWTKKIGSTGDDSFYSVEQKNNRIYVVGKQFNSISNKNESSVYKLDFNGNILNHNLFALNSTENTFYNDLYVTHSGDLLVCGKRYMHSDTDSSEHYVLRKIDTTNFNQINYLSSGQNFDMKCVLEGNNNDVYTLSPSNDGLGGLSALYLRFNSGFAYSHSANFGGTQDDEAFEIIRTSSGGYAFVGSTKSYGNENGSAENNVYFVVFNKKDLVNDYFIITDEFQDNLSPVGISSNTLAIQKTIIFPNPVNFNASIGITDKMLNNKTVNYQLFDQNGSLVDEENIIVKDDNLVITRKNIKTGVYTYRLKLNSTCISVGTIAFD